MPRLPVILTPLVLCSFARDAAWRARVALACVKAWLRWRAWGLRALCVLLAFTTLAPPAWDAEAMQRAAQTQGPLAVSGARALRGLLTSAVGQDDALRLGAINEFFNRRIVFTPDSEVWGQTDYCASPPETLGKGRGDCEDCVIAKYFSGQSHR